MPQRFLQHSSKMNNLNLWNKNVFINISTWTVLISSMRNYQQKMNFTVSYKLNTYLMNNTNMLKMCGRHLTSRHWVNTKICILNLTSCYQQMYLRTSDRLVCNIINLTHATISYLLAAGLSWDAVLTSNWN